MLVKRVAMSLLAVMILLLAGCGTSEPPAPRITMNGQTVEPVLSTHCWKDIGCADYPNAPDQLAAMGYKPIEISNAFPEMKVDFRPAPSELSMSNWWEGKWHTIMSPEENRRIVFPLNAHTPNVKGVHTIMVTGKWKDGSASWVFQYMVK